jgi:hypothetical protein
LFWSLTCVEFVDDYIDIYAITLHKNSEEPYHSKHSRIAKRKKDSWHYRAPLESTQASSVVHTLIHAQRQIG